MAKEATNLAEEATNHKPNMQRGSFCLLNWSLNNHLWCHFLH